MNNSLSFVAENGILFAARLVQAGEGYGTWDPAKNAWTMRLPDDGKTILEFYDQRNPAQADTPYGTFTGGRYYLHTLMNDRQLRSGEGNALLLTGRHNDMCIDAKSLREVLSWAYGLCPGLTRFESGTRMEAAQDMQGFEVRLVACAPDETAEIWRARHPEHMNNAFDIVVTRMGISVFGDLGSLVFNVGAQKGIKFLAGEDLTYIHGKLDEAFRRQEELDPKAVAEVVANGVVEYLDNIWYGPAARGVPDGAVHKAVEGLRKAQDPALALDVLVQACAAREAGWQAHSASYRPDEVGRLIGHLVLEVSEAHTVEELRRALDDASSDFLGAFDDLSGCNITVASQHVMRKLHMVNQAARQIMAIKEQEAASLESPGAQRERR